MGQAIIFKEGEMEYGKIRPTNGKPDLHR